MAKGKKSGEAKGNNANKRQKKVLKENVKSISKGSIRRLARRGGALSLLEKFQLLKKLGYDGVELDSPSDLKADDVLRARDATGLQIPGVVDSVHWSKTLGDPDQLFLSRQSPVKI